MCFFVTLQYFRKEYDLFALDPEALSCEGDTVLIQKLAKTTSKEILFRVNRVVQRLGDVYDPLTGKPVVADHYRDEMDMVANTYGKLRENFVYAKALKRGSQLGKRDFTDKVTYYKWHVFKDKNDDGYGLVS